MLDGTWPIGAFCVVGEERRVSSGSDVTFTKDEYTRLASGEQSRHDAETNVPRRNKPTTWKGQRGNVQSSIHQHAGKWHPLHMHANTQTSWLELARDLLSPSGMADDDSSFVGRQQQVSQVSQHLQFIGMQQVLANTTQHSCVHSQQVRRSSSCPLEETTAGGRHGGHGVRPCARRGQRAASANSNAPGAIELEWRQHAWCSDGASMLVLRWRQRAGAAMAAEASLRAGTRAEQTHQQKKTTCKTT